MKTCEPSLTVLLCTFMPCLYVTFQELLGCVLELTLSATGPDFFRSCLYMYSKVLLERCAVDTL